MATPLALESALHIDLGAEQQRIQARMREIVRNFRRRGCIVAISGGIDSSVCAALAVGAFGSSKVLGLLLPERDSSGTSTARGRLLASWMPPADPAQRRPYESGPGRLDMKEALRYVLTLPVSTVIIGCDSPAQVEENVAIAKSFVPLSPAQMASLEQRSEPVHRQALFFRRWDT